MFGSKRRKESDRLSVDEIIALGKKITNWDTKHSDTGGYDVYRGSINDVQVSLVHEYYSFWNYSRRTLQAIDLKGHIGLGCYSDNEGGRIQLKIYNKIYKFHDYIRSILHAEESRRRAEREPIIKSALKRARDLLK